jgi:hypothetical protein
MGVSPVSILGFIFITAPLIFIGVCLLAFIFQMTVVGLLAVVLYPLHWLGIVNLEEPKK